MITARDVETWSCPDPKAERPAVRVKRRPAVKPRFEPIIYKEPAPKTEEPKVVQTFYETHLEKGTVNDSAASLIGKKTQWTRWTINDLFAAVRMDTEGLTYEQIGEKLGRPKGSVQKKIQEWRKTHGLGRKKPRRKE